MTIGEKMDELQAEAEKLVAVLKDRQIGLMVWNEMLGARMRAMQRLLDEALGAASQSVQ